MTVLDDFHPHTLSVTEAAAAGVPSLIRDAENGGDVIVARRGHPVAAVVSMRRLDQLRVLEADLRDLALVMTRAATDTPGQETVASAATRRHAERDGPTGCTRRLTVGNRDWRVVWRVSHDQAGGVIADVAEVRAAGARSDGEVYAEMTDSVRTLPDSPRTTALADLVVRLGKVAEGLTATPEPAQDTDQQPLPPWLRTRLIDQVGMPAVAVDALTLEQAVDSWTTWSSRPH